MRTEITEAQWLERAIKTLADGADAEQVRAILLEYLVRKQSDLLAEKLAHARDQAA